MVTEEQVKQQSKQARRGDTDEVDPMIVAYTQGYRSELLSRMDNGQGETGTFIKTARIVARRIPVPFMVETSAGPLRGQAGDWLATNHPDDDPGSDIWPISADRMRATYQPADKGSHSQRQGQGASEGAKADHRDTSGSDDRQRGAQREVGSIADQGVPYVDNGGKQADEEPRAKRG